MNFAEELRQLAETVSKKYQTLELAAVQDKLKKTAQEGKFYCIFDDLSNETVDRLKEDGFKVETGGRYNEINYFVKW
jgi:hypothetical protein